MLGCVLIFGGIATADVTTDKTHAEMNPAVANFDAILADVSIRAGDADLVEMCTFGRHRTSQIVPLTASSAARSQRPRIAPASYVL